MSPVSPFEPGGVEIRRLVDEAVDRIVRYLETLPEQAAGDTAGGVELARSLAEPLPEAGRPLEELLDLVFERAAPLSFNAAGPGYLAFIPGGGLFASALADLVAGSINRYTGVFAAAPALVQLEANVLRWFAEIVGYPEAARGILTSGGSLAVLTAIVTARRERLPENFLSATLYVSDQTHHSVAKAAVLAGFPPGNVREVETDGAFRIRLDRLAERVAEDRRLGLSPFLVVGNAGTVNTGAIDPLPELARFAREEGLWLHADAAYGGFFMLTERGRAALAGIEQADSVVLDPHKGLFLPYGNGALLVRDGQALRRAHAFGARYLPASQEDPDLVDFHLYGPELSKPYRGLRAWLPLKLYGAESFRRELDEKLDLARWIAGELRGIEHLTMVAEPELSLLAFRLEPPGIAEAERNRLNREVLERVNARQRVLLTGTVLPDERFVLRVCVLSFRTHMERMEMALADLKAAIGEALGGAGLGVS
ncbi:MAG TPA: aminotransferase class I/II-fold pyridoxal phosphate-dependent enzyme [Thermoanaerobaculia bacterium]|nr:aminotransferase class I/II-fold pyridoxal phosphate-dependent enzyme [Thermoanaerobaculia bacterium]